MDPAVDSAQIRLVLSYDREGLGRWHLGVTHIENHELLASGSSCVPGPGSAVDIITHVRTILQTLLGVSEGEQLSIFDLLDHPF